MASSVSSSARSSGLFETPLEIRCHIVHELKAGPRIALAFAAYKQLQDDGFVPRMTNEWIAELQRQQRQSRPNLTVEVLRFPTEIMSQIMELLSFHDLIKLTLALHKELAHVNLAPQMTAQIMATLNEARRQ